MELLYAAFSTVNLPFTVLLILILLYWLSVIIGALDVSSFDIDLDMDADVEPGMFHGFLAFLNLGELPFMLIASIFVVSTWAISILSNYYLDNSSLLLALGLAVPNLLVSLLITKLVSIPFISVFKQLNRDPGGEIKAVGSLCTLQGRADEERVAQAEVVTGGAPLTLMVRTRQGESLPEGARALVVEKDPEKDVYIVESFDDWES